MKIFLGGIPLGCDNIGDEAILACAVEILRRNFPGCSITVCTADREHTAKLLKVETAPLFGFDPNAPLEEFRQIAARHDFYLWAGATGLSDYPETAIRLLDAARSAGTPSVVWGVGMDSELNPAFFRVAGRRKKLLELASALSLQTIDFVEKYEHFLASRTRKRLAKALEQCLLVVVRDPQTALELSRCGFRKAVIGADSAIILRETPQDRVIREEGIHKIGFCLSAQRRVTDEAPLLEMLDRILADDSNRIVFIPMNPKTDRELMNDLRAKLKRPDRAFLLEDCSEPDRVQSVAANCDVIVSSRLHLLILAANVGTPIVGISRGSKVDNFLSNFGFTPAGTVRNCDFTRLYENVMAFRDNPAVFRKSAEDIHEKLMKRLSSAELLLRETVEKRIDSEPGGKS